MTSVVRIEIIANTKAYEADLKKASQEFTRFSNSVTRGANRLQRERTELERSRKTLNDYRRAKIQAAESGKNLGSGLRNLVLGGAGLAALVLTMKRFVEETTKAAIELQRTEARFTQFTKSTFLTAEALEFVGDAANSMVISLDTARDAYARLLVLQDAGILTTGQLRDLFLGFADAAAALGASQAQVSQSLFGLSQALTSPIVRAEELNQVMESLPGLLQAVDRALGLAAGGFRQLVLSGQVTNTFFRDSLTKGLQEFQGAAEALNEGAGGALNEIRNELQLTAEAIGGTFTEALQSSRGAIVGTIQALRGLGAAGQELEQSAADAQAFRDLTDQISEYGDELEKIKLAGTSARLEEIWEQARAGIISANDALNQARDLYETITNAVKQQQGAITRLRQAQTAAFNASRIEAYKDRIRESNTELDKAKDKLKALERAEAQAANRIQAIRQELADNTRSVEEEIADLRRSQLSESSQQASLTLEIGRKIAEAANQAAAARSAQGEIEQKTALEASKAAADRARDLSREITDTNTRILLTKKAGDAQAATLKAEQALIQDQQKAREADKVSLKSQIDEIEARIKTLTDILDGLTGKERTITLAAETEAAKKDLIEIENLLKTLSLGVTIPIRTPDGPLTGVRRERWGGMIPGYGGGDRRPALLEDGEFIIRKEAVRHYGMSLFDRLNSMGTRMPAIPEIGRTGYQTGGAVRGEEVTLNLTLNGSRSKLRGGRDDVRVLVDALSQMARAT